MVLSQAPSAAPSPSAGSGNEAPSVRLANTQYLVRGRLHDSLGSRASAVDWLRAELASPDLRALCGTTPASSITLDKDELVALKLLRDTLTALFATAPPFAPEQVAVLNTMCRRAPSWIELDTAGRLVHQQDVPLPERARAAYAADAIEILSGARGTTVRQCQASGCVQFFVSNRRQQQWCSDSCGNRARVARHYQRHHRQAMGTGGY